VNAVRSRVLPLLAGIGTVAAAAGVLAGPSPAAIAGGILLGFALPGYAFTELLSRRRTLIPVERAVLAPALSLATVIICGLLLNAARIPLDRTSWTFAAAGVTLVVLALTAVPTRARRDAGGEPVEAATEVIPVTRDGDPGAPPTRTPRALPGPFAPWSAGHPVDVRRSMRRLVPMIMVVAVLTGAGYLSFASSRASYDVTVTTLSAAPPGAVNAAGNRVVEVTASGLVVASGPYDLLVTDRAGTEVLKRAVPADAGGNWTARLTLPATGRLTLRLFRAGDTTAYRTLLLAAG
jgi:hypothetical protein